MAVLSSPAYSPGLYYIPCKSLRKFIFRKYFCVTSYPLLSGSFCNFGIFKNKKFFDHNIDHNISGKGNHLKIRTQKRVPFHGFHIVRCAGKLLPNTKNRFFLLGVCFSESNSESGQKPLNHNSRSGKRNGREIHPSF